MCSIFRFSSSIEPTRSNKHILKGFPNSKKIINREVTVEPAFQGWNIIELKFQRLSFYPGICRRLRIRYRWRANIQGFVFLKISIQIMSVDPLDGNGQLFLCLQDLTLNSFLELAFRARAQRTEKKYL